MTIFGPSESKCAYVLPSGKSAVAEFFIVGERFVVITRVRKLLKCSLSCQL
jgi:hypothetical protein